MSPGLSMVLPADANPYLSLNGVYKSHLVLRHPQSANLQLFCLAIIHGVTVVLLLASLLINWWKARFWFIRRRAATPLLVLNLPIVGALVSIALIMVFEVALARSIQSFDGWLQKDYGFWLLFSGSIRHVIAEVAIWTLAASTITRSQVKGSQLAFWSYFCNLVGIATPLLTVLAGLVLAILGGMKYASSVGAYDQLNAFLIEESHTWSRTNLTNRFVPAPKAIMEAFGSNLEGIEKWWKISFLFSGIVGAFLTAAVIVITALYLFSLRKNVVQMGQTLDTTAYARVEGSQPRRNSPWTLLLRVLVTVILFASMTLALEFYVYLRPFSFQSRTTSAALLFIPFYLSSVAGLIFGLALVFNACSANSSSKDAEKSWKTVCVRKWMMYKRRNDIGRSVATSARMGLNVGAVVPTISEFEASRAESNVEDEKTCAISFDAGECDDRKLPMSQEDGPTEGHMGEEGVKVMSTIDAQLDIERDEGRLRGHGQKAEN